MGYGETKPPLQIRERRIDDNRCPVYLAVRQIRYGMVNDNPARASAMVVSSQTSGPPDDWFSTTKAPDRMQVPPGVVTETSLGPVFASLATVISAVICVGLSLLRLLTVTPSPKLTDVAPERLVPDIVTLRVSPVSPVTGPIDAIVGDALRALPSATV